MGKLYVLNTQTHCYHIKGCCPNAVGNDSYHHWFSSETELRTSDPDARLCKNCAKKREINEKKNINN